MLKPFCRFMFFFVLLLSCLPVSTQPGLYLDAFISSAHAENVSSFNRGEALKRLTGRDSRTSPRSLLPVQLLVAEGNADNDKWVRVFFYFKSTHIRLAEEERKRLEQALWKFKVTQTTQVNIILGPVPSEKNILLPQIAKLRAQATARIIFPYTQNVAIMLCRAKVSPGVMIIEISRPPI
ncbi:MAG: hypothetical protein GY862_09305 [Gammaproteobacteria bacterium]|nr:hypothetical protein [Gammaproteobacteria bacterium]